MRPFKDGLSLVLRRPSVIIGFFALNLILARIGTVPFQLGASHIMGHSLAGGGLLHGFDLALLAELLSRPEMGQGGGAAAGISAVLFALISLLLLPGVYFAYASGARVSRESLLAACGRHLWRFIRLAVVFFFCAAILGGILGLLAKLVGHAADHSTREQLSFWVGLGSAAVILVAMTLLRMWFDLAQAHVVIRDQKAVRKSLAAGFRLLRARGLRLLGVYLLVTVLALVVAALGLRCWYQLVPSASVFGAFLVGQGILLLLLIARFWQRAAAVVVVSAP